MKTAGALRGETIISGAAPDRGGYAKLLSVVTANNSVSLVTTAFDNAKFDTYLVELDHLIPDTNGAGVRMTVSSDGGASFPTTGYGWQALMSSLSNYSPPGIYYYSGDAQAWTDAFVMTHGCNQNSCGTTGRIRIFLGGLQHITWHCDGYYYPDYYSHHMIGGGFCTTVGVINALRWRMTSGLITSGVVRLYGMRNELNLA